MKDRGGPRLAALSTGFNPLFAASSILKAMTLPNSRNLYESNERNRLRKSVKNSLITYILSMSGLTHLLQTPSSTPTRSPRSCSVPVLSHNYVHQSTHSSSGECTTVQIQTASRTYSPSINKHNKNFHSNIPTEAIVE